MEVGVGLAACGSRTKRYANKNVTLAAKDPKQCFQVLETFESDLRDL